MAEIQNEIPHWNLDSIYPSLNSDEYKNDVANLENVFCELKMQLSNQKNDFLLWLNDFLELLNKEFYLLKTLSAYAYIIYSTDTTNPSYTNNLNLINKYEIQSNQIYIKFSKVLFENKALLDDFYKKFPQKANINIFLTKFWKKNHI